MRLALIVLVAGCTEHVQLGGGDGRLPGLVSLAVAPADTTIAFDAVGAAPQHVAYVATGTFEDGDQRDVTDLVDWSAENPFPGEFARPGDYTATAKAAGHVGVHATSGDVDGAAALTITMSATVIDSVFPPANATVFDGVVGIGSDPMKQPIVRYPAHEVRFPQGMQQIVFQYDRGTGNDTTRLHFESDVLDLSIITGGDRFQPDSTIWNLIAESHPNGAVALTVDTAASAAPGTMFRAAPVTMNYSAGAATDLIYAFSSTALGVVRGSLAEASAASIASAAADPHHAVSRDGSRMALGSGEKLSMVDLDSLAQVLPPMAPMGYAAFSPDGRFVLVSDKGTLTLRDATTGAAVGPGGGKVPLGAMLKGTHPDWSPDGNSVVFAASDVVDNNDGKHLSIARVAFTEGTWGAVEILVQSTGDMDSNFAPRWGPAGSIAYVHATSGFKDTKMAELRLLPAGGAPLTLARASSRVGSVTQLDVDVTMPSWTYGSDGAAWLAFASTRPYGVIRPAKGSSQVWVAGVDLSLASLPAADPSFAGFWLPCQDVTAVNGNPVWAPVPITSE